MYNKKIHSIPAFHALALIYHFHPNTWPLSDMKQYSSSPVQWGISLLKVNYCIRKTFAKWLIKNPYDDDSDHDSAWYSSWITHNTQNETNNLGCKTDICLCWFIYLLDR